MYWDCIEIYKKCLSAKAKQKNIECRQRSPCPLILLILNSDSGNYKLHSTNCIPEAVRPCNYMLAEEESDTSVEDVLMKKIAVLIF